jgi:hypothetical protein
MQDRDDPTCLKESQATSVRLVVTSDKQTLHEYKDPTSRYEEYVDRKVKLSRPETQHNRDDLTNEILKQANAKVIIQTMSDDMATNSTSDESTMTLRSGRVVGKWHAAQERLRHDINMVGDNIKFNFTDPPDPRHRPMSEVFNIPELLEEILQELSPAFLLQKVQKVCRGFKDSIDSSPTFRLRSSFAIYVDKVDGFPPLTFCVNLIPKSLVMSPSSAASHFHFVFSGDSDTTTFESHRRMTRLRGMHMFDPVPQWIFAYWRRSDGRAISKAWMVEDRGNAVTFGELFDAVAEEPLANGKVLEELHVVWSESRG